MDWDTKRRLAYGGAVVFFTLAVFLYVFRDSLFPQPTCFDAVKNGNENGIDCGGVCALRCTEDVVPLRVAWSRALKTAPYTYDFVALVSNKNIDNAPRLLPYTFTAYGEEGEVLASITGTTTSPVDGNFPIVRQNIRLEKEPKEIITEIKNSAHFTVKELPSSPTLRVSTPRYEAGSIPRVYTTISNTKRLSMYNLPIRILLYDNTDTVIGVGETLVPFLDKEESKEISFSWNLPFENPPTVMRVYPVFDPFLQEK